MLPYCGFKEASRLICVWSPTICFNPLKRDQNIFFKVNLKYGSSFDLIGHESVAEKAACNYNP